MKIGAYEASYNRLDSEKSTWKFQYGKRPALDGNWNVKEVPVKLFDPIRGFLTGLRFLGEGLLLSARHCKVDFALRVSLKMMAANATSMITRIAYIEFNETAAQKSKA